MTGGIFSTEDKSRSLVASIFPTHATPPVERARDRDLKFKLRPYRPEVLGRSIIDLVEGMYSKGSMSDMQETIRDGKVL